MNESYRLNDIYKKLKVRITGKDVHEIRISIKKLKAYRRLYYILCPENESKRKISITNNLFDISGRMRNIQVCLALLKKYEKAENCSYPGTRNYLLFKLKQSRQWTKQAFEEYKTDDLTEFEKLLQTAPAVNINEEETKITQAIKKVFRSIHHSSDKPHELRILLKRIYYWLKILPEESAASLFNLEKMNHIMTLLGDWQDNEILLEEINHYRKKVLAGTIPERELLKRLSYNLNQKKKLMSRDAMGEIKHIRR